MMVGCLRVISVGVAHCGEGIGGCLFYWQARFPNRTITVPSEGYLPTKVAQS
jgi:hypothetical protein